MTINKLDGNYDNAAGSQKWRIGIGFGLVGLGVAISLVFATRLHHAWNDLHQFSPADGVGLIVGMLCASVGGTLAVSAKKVDEVSKKLIELT